VTTHSCHGLKQLVPILMALRISLTPVDTVCPTIKVIAKVSIKQEYQFSLGRMFGKPNNMKFCEHVNQTA